MPALAGLDGWGGGGRVPAADAAGCNCAGPVGPRRAGRRGSRSRRWRSRLQLLTQRATTMPGPGGPCRAAQSAAVSAWSPIEVLVRPGRIERLGASPRTRGAAHVGGRRRADGPPRGGRRGR